MLNNKNYGSILNHIKQEKQGRRNAVLLSCSDISKHIKELEIINHNQKLRTLVSALEFLKEVNNE
jgi:hypothetical protein